MRILGKIKAIGKLKFAPTKDPYELLRRMIKITGVAEMRKLMYRGITKDAKKANKKGQLDKLIADVHSSDSFKALMADLDMTMEEVDGIIENAKEG